MPSARYASSHVSPKGAGDARPTALQIIEDEGLVGKLSDKIIVITGATSGIGLETARALKATGATLYLTARNFDSAKKALGDILEPGRVELVQMDHDSLASVRSAASEILSKTSGKINILVENAGIMGVPTRQLTEDGHELHFQTNYLAHFLLFQLLKPALTAAATPSFSSRVVVVSSAAHKSATTLPASSDYDSSPEKYDAQVAYAESGLAKVYLANSINRLYSSKGVYANSLHPGGIGGTGMSRYVGPGFVKQLEAIPGLLELFKSQEQGAATTVLAAVGKEWEGVGGKYLEDCAEAIRGADDGQTFAPGYAKQTFDPEAEARLWSDSFEMVGMDESA